MEIFLSFESWVAILTLTFLEVVLGIDNIIFISIVVNKIPHEDQKKARLLGLSLALAFRIIMLLSITWIIGSTKPFLNIGSYGLSLRDLILFFGAGFLIYKSTHEIYNKIEGTEHRTDVKTHSFKGVIFQIVMLDIIFSFDSILTAIGLTREVTLMVIGVIAAMGIMLLFANYISEIINKYHSLQVLALAFLILIAFNLVLDGLHYHIPKAYTYVAVAFSLTVELINIMISKRAQNKAIQE